MRSWLYFPSIAMIDDGLLALMLMFVFVPTPPRSNRLSFRILAIIYFAQFPPLPMTAPAHATSWLPLRLCYFFFFCLAAADSLDLSDMSEFFSASLGTRESFYFFLFDPLSGAGFSPFFFFALSRP